MVAIFGRRENDKSENMSFTIETTVQIISEHGNEPIIKNQRELKNDDVAELLNVIDTTEMFELPPTRHQKDESEAVFGFAEKWTSESKMSKIIARDLRESRVMDDFFRIIYLLAGKR
jgi:hemerythrin-like domain-containing protein